MKYLCCIEKKLPSPSKSCGDDIIIGDFKQILVQASFIDKTLLIEVFLITIKNGNEPFLAITAPRGFGKSTNISMIKRFLEIALDDNGIPVSDVTTTSNHALFLNTKIYRETIFYEHFGKYPVIFLSFRSSHIITSFGILQSICRKSIHDCYIQHAHLLHSPRLSNAEKNTVKLWSGRGFKSANRFRILEALQILCQCLFKHHGTKACLLIDDYDSPIVNATFNAKVKDFDVAVNFMTTLYGNVLRNNLFIQCGILTGVSRLHDLACELNTVKQIRFLENHKFVEFYGMLQDDIVYLLNKFGFENLKQAEILKYYEGYLSLTNIRVYNYQSILNCLYSRNVVNYWNDFNYISNVELMFRIYSIRYCVESFLEDKFISYRFLASKRRDIERIRGRILDDVCYYRPEVIESFFFDRGYLTFVTAIESVDNIYNVKVPNMDVWKYSMDLLQKYYTVKCNFSKLSIQNCISAFNLLSTSITILELNHLKDTLHELFKMFNDTKFISLNKTTAHSLILYILLQSKFKCRSQVFVTGWCRISFLLVYDDLGFIIKLKIGGDISKSSVQAIKSIVNKEYYKVFEANLSVKHYILMGLSLNNGMPDICCLVNNLDSNNALCTKLTITH